MNLKFDYYTRIRTNYLGLNVRYIEQKTNKPVTKTLCVTVTLLRHTSMELRKILQKALDDFGISINNILCCVTDNVTHVVKMVRDLGEERAATAAASTRADARVVSVKE